MDPCVDSSLRVGHDNVLHVCGHVGLPDTCGVLPRPPFSSSDWETPPCLRADSSALAKSDGAAVCEREEGGKEGEKEREREREREREITLIDSILFFLWAQD